MVRLPALCVACGAVYPSPLASGSSGGDNAFAVPVPCPGCGTGGRVPPESLRRTEAMCEVLAEAAPPADRARTMLDELEAACREADGREDAVLDALRRVPELGRLPGSLPGEGPEEMAAAVRLARVAVDLLGAGEAEASPAALAERVLEEAYERFAPERPEEEPDGPAERARARLEEAGRNDPCPCGSGRKYKRCHWVEDRRSARG